MGALGSLSLSPVGQGQREDVTHELDLGHQGSAPLPYAWDGALPPSPSLLPEAALSTQPGAWVRDWPSLGAPGT